MQIVIDIDEEVFNSVKMGMRYTDDVKNIMAQIENSTPLPKGHGRLIDESEMSQKLDEYYYLNEMYTLKIIKETIKDKVPTVLEADKEI